MSTWSLLRGLTREARHWGDFPQLLQAAYPETRVVALELPGNGLRNSEPSPTTVAELAAQAHAEAARLGLRPPYHLLALSLGAMVATAWAEAWPREVDACVLINTSFAAFNPLLQRLQPRAWPSLLRILLSPTALERERLVFALTSSLPPETHEPAIRAWAELRRSHPVALRNALRQLLASARYRAPWKAPVPTLVLFGAGDRLVDPRCSQEIARRWRCHRGVHPFAGHDLPLDDGPWVVDQVRRWRRP